MVAERYRAKWDVAWVNSGEWARDGTGGEGDCNKISYGGEYWMLFSVSWGGGETYIMIDDGY